MLNRLENKPELGVQQPVVAAEKPALIPISPADRDKTDRSEAETADDNLAAIRAGDSNAGVTNTADTVTSDSKGGRGVNNAQQGVPKPANPAAKAGKKGASIKPVAAAEHAAPVVEKKTAAPKSKKKDTVIETEVEIVDPKTVAVRDELSNYQKGKSLDDVSSSFSRSCRTVNGIGLELSEDAKIEDVADSLQFLMTFGENIQFMIGDLLIASDAKFGDCASQVALATGYSYQTLANAQWVARNIPIDSRNPKLTFSHHKVVVTNELTDRERTLLLDTAVKTGQTVKQLKDEVNVKLAAKRGPVESPTSEKSTPEPAPAPESKATTEVEKMDITDIDHEQAFEKFDDVLTFLRHNYGSLSSLKQKAWKTAGAQFERVLS